MLSKFENQNLNKNELRTNELLIKRFIVKKTMVKGLLLSGLLLIATTTNAGDITPEEGLKHLSQNIETSTKNRNEYNKSIDLVSHNIVTLESASIELSNQKKRLQSQIDENKKNLVLHTKKQQEIEKSRKDEEHKSADELNKITQLEKTLLQLKELQKIRQDRLQQLAIDKGTIEKSQKEGETLQLTLAGETKTIDQRIDSLKKEITPWRSKKKSYEKEAARWGNELNRHEKMEAEVKLLMDSTT